MIPKFVTIDFPHEEVTDWIPYRGWVFQLITFETGFTYKICLDDEDPYGIWSAKLHGLIEAFHSAREAIDTHVDGHDLPRLLPFQAAIALAMHLKEVGS